MTVQELINILEKFDKKLTVEITGETGWDISEKFIKEQVNCVGEKILNIHLAWDAGKTLEKLKQANMY